MKRGIIILLVTVLMAISSSGITLFASDQIIEEVQTVLMDSPDPIIFNYGKDNDELFKDYVDQLFYPKMRIRSTIDLDKDIDRKAYDHLQQKVKDIADGTESSSVIELPLDFFGCDTTTEYTAEMLGVSKIIENGAITDEAKNAMWALIGWDYSTVIRQLMANCPYELYWYDKVAGIKPECPVSIEAYYNSKYAYMKFVIMESNGTTAWRLPFSVSENYKGSGVYSVDTGKTGAAKSAVEHADAVISNNNGKTDVQKLEAYRDYILTQVEYNDNAANDNTHTPYGDPWQLIWVFDEDSTTNVVCEGYAKAFKYLCDKGISGSSVDCDLVTGDMTATTNGEVHSGRHMWNLVTISGNTYLTDITNIDGNSIGAQGKVLFLTGAEGTPANGYTKGIGNSTVTYSYDADTKKLYSEQQLSVSERGYYEIDQAVADVINKINAIGTVEYSAMCHTKIDDARKAYDALSDEQKTNVDNYNVLTEAEVVYAQLAAAATTVEYKFASADINGKVTYSTETASSCVPVASDTTEWRDGNWYVVNGNTTISNRIAVNGTVNLILSDGAVLNANSGITVSGTNTLNIYGQIGGTGKLIAKSTGKNTAVGGDESSGSGGTIAIHGGVIEASGINNDSAVIGGTRENEGCDLTVFGGSVSASNNGYGAGIGGGYLGEGGILIIYGGSVTGTSTNGIGVGGNKYKGSGSITIHGGTITARSDSNHAVLSLQKFIMTGGRLTAEGGIDGIVSGGGILISGGDVTGKGETIGIHSEGGALEIGPDITKLTAIGDSKAIYSTNDIISIIPGTGWTDTEGSVGRTKINPNPQITDIVNFKKIQFPAVVIPVTNVTLNKTITTLTVGASETLTATIAPTDADQTVIWISSDTGVATVQDGNITANQIGTATITATATNGTVDTNDDKTATCVVTVKKRELSELNVSISGWTYGSNAASPNVTGNIGNGTVTFEYKMKDADDSTYTATVPASAGSYTVRATVAESEQYASAMATANFIIQKASGTISFEETKISKTYGDADFVNVLNNTGDGAVIYSSDNENIAKVNTETGEVSIAGVGEAAVTAVVADGTNYTYENKEVTFTIQVSAASMSVSAEGYTGTYDGNSHGITVSAPQDATVKYGTEENSFTLGASPDYTDVGSYTIYYKVTKQNYETVTGFAIVTISVATVDNMTVVLTEAAPGQIPEVTVKVGEKALNADVDYTVRYRDDFADVDKQAIEEEMKASTVDKEILIVVTLTGNYSGGTTNTFTVKSPNKVKADAVIEKINAIGTVSCSDTCKALIDDAREAYNALSDVQKGLVTNTSTLEDAEATYSTLKMAADQAAADSVIASINVIDTVEYTDACKVKINTARAAYDSLTADQRLLVTNYGTLTAAEAEYLRLKAEADAITDQAAADEVIGKINAIGTVSYSDSSKALINAARTAYNALTNSQKVLVSNYATLTAAEDRYAELKTAAERAANQTVETPKAEVPKAEAPQTEAPQPEAPPAPQSAPAVEEPITIPKTPSAIKVTSKKNKATITWKKLKITKKTKKQLGKIKAVQMQYSTDPSFRENVTDKRFGKNKTKAAIGVPKGTTLYVRLRYVGSDGVSRWSGVKSVRAK